MSSLSHLRVLLWKNCLIQRRAKCITFVEILSPILFAVLLMVIRIISIYQFDEDIHFEASLLLANQSSIVEGDGNEIIGYTPDFPCLQEVMTKVAAEFAINDIAVRNVTALPFDTEQKLVDFYKVHKTSMKLAVVFKEITNSSTLPDTLTYFIRPKGSSVWNTQKMFPISQFNRAPTDYISSGVSHLQTLIGIKVIEAWSGKDLRGVVMQRQQMPIYKENWVVRALSFSLTPCIMMSFMVSLMMNTKNIVYEKENKLKESLKLMGLKPVVYWTSWFITYMVYLTFASALYICLLGISFSGNGPVLGKSDPSLAFCFLIIYAMSLVSFCFMISTFVQRENIGAVVSCLAYLFTYFQYLFLHYMYYALTYRQKIISGFFFNTALALGINLYDLFQDAGQALTWSNIHKPVNSSDNYSLLDSIIMLLVDTVIHLLVTWYIDNVYPGDFGVPKPYYFLLTKAYWCGASLTAVNQTPYMDSKYFECEPLHLHPGINIIRLRKAFGKKVAVKSVSLKIYEGQITVLLGHNGAGKSSTIFMLTGFFEPSSGTAIVNNHDIRTNIDSIRKCVGLCPQHDMIFNTLTVKEHLIFFARLKGCPISQVPKEVEPMMEELGLKAFKDENAMTLSEGQKRKLSVGIAFINRPKVVILDEPSTGMEPGARKEMWDMLLSHCAGRTILVATNLMDEASFLGSRIAIIAEGKVQCCGSPMFLKKLYGTGYHLTLVKNDESGLEEVEKLIKTHVSSACIENETDTELSFLLPDDQSFRFPDLFRELEKKKNELGIEDYWITTTSMDEVYIKLRNSVSSDEDNQMDPDSKYPESESQAAQRLVNANIDETGRQFNPVENRELEADEKSLLSLPHSEVDYENISEIGNTLTGDTEEAEDPSSAVQTDTAGYYLTLMKTNKCKREDVEKIIKKHIPIANFSSEIDTQLSFILPEDQSFHFPDLLNELNSQKAKLGILSVETTAVPMVEKTASKESAYGCIHKDIAGNGYHLILVKTDTCLLNAVKEIVQKHIPSAFLESEINSELYFFLPDNQSSHFPDLLSELETRKDELGIGMTTASVEEVSKIGGNASVKSASRAQVTPNKRNSDFGSQAAHDLINIDIAAFNSDYTKATGCQLFLLRLRAMLMKKILYVLRNPVMSLMQLMLPICFASLVLLEKLNPKEEEQALSFNLDTFGRTFIPYTNHNLPLGLNFSKLYAAQFGGSHDLEIVNICNTPACWSSLNKYILYRAKKLTLSVYNKRMIIGAEALLNGNFSKGTARAYYNVHPYHSLPIAIAALLNAFARLSAGINKTLYSGLHPFPQEEAGDKELSSPSNPNFIEGFLLQFILSIGMAFLTSSFAYFVTQERMTGAKHLQMVSGIGPVMFWMSTIVWDYFHYLITCVFILLMFALLSVEFGSGSQLISTMLVFLHYGWAILPCVYLLSFLFAAPKCAFIIIMIFSIFNGYFSLLAVEIIHRDFWKWNVASELIDSIFLAVSPNHCFGSAIISIFSNYRLLHKCTNFFNYTTLCLQRQGICCKGIGKGCEGNQCYIFTDNLLTWTSPGIGRNLIRMFLQGCAFMSLTLLIEIKLPQRIFTCLKTKLFDKGTSTLTVYDNLKEDVDVHAERVRINAIPPSEMRYHKALFLVNLHKIYEGFVAVDHICVGIPEQGCLGLLGTYGSGKSTTLKMLTGLSRVGEGNAYFNGLDIKNNIRQVQANIGYCPQFDALINHMTAREMLTMYAGLRGIPSKNTADVVNSLIDLLTLRPYADKKCSQYSGTNKRKLSNAIALVGNPSFILLDEPSLGMDPASQRQLWNVLSAVHASGKTLVLTSHSIEECDALCSLIAIMVDGHIVCLGSPQHLKSKFCQGYIIIAKMKDSDDGVRESHNNFISYVKTWFSGAFVLNDYKNCVLMQLPDPEIHLADVFTVMETAQFVMNVKDYSVCRITLEQVFFTFVHG